MGHRVLYMRPSEPAPVWAALERHLGYRAWLVRWSDQSVSVIGMDDHRVLRGPEPSTTQEAVHIGNDVI